MIGGAALIIVGSFLPWAQIRSIFATLSVNGMDGDGILTLAGGVIIAVLGFTAIGKTERGESQSLLWYVSFPVTVGVAVIGLLNFANISEIIADPDALVAPGYGPGLFLIIGGAGLATIGALRIPRQQPGEPWTPTELPTNLGVRDDAQITGLERLRDLHAAGEITDEEYRLAKSRLLSGGS